MSARKEMTSIWSRKCVAAMLPVFAAAAFAPVAYSATLFSENFDSYTNGDNFNTIPQITTAELTAGDSVTVSTNQALSGLNSLKYTSDNSAGAQPDLFFNFSSPVTAATPGLNLSFSYQKFSDIFNPQMWVMFGGPNTGFANGNIALQGNGLNNFFADSGGFEFLGQGANWVTINVAYTFTNDGTNITGYTGNFTTSGGANNPVFSRTKTGLSIASIDSLRFQFRENAGDVYLDNVSATVIPEPTAMALLGMGVVSLLRRRRMA